MKKENKNNNNFLNNTADLRYYKNPRKALQDELQASYINKQQPITTILNGVKHTFKNFADYKKYILATKGDTITS